MLIEVLERFELEFSSEAGYFGVSGKVLTVICLIIDVHREDFCARFYSFMKCFVVTDSEIVAVPKEDFLRHVVA
jgi:hypothetical protein